jgi:hypothetical protein
MLRRMNQQQKIPNKRNVSALVAVDPVQHP